MANSGDRYDYVFSVGSCACYVVYSGWSYLAVTEDDARVIYIYIIQKTTVKDLLYHEIKFCQEESTRNMKINIRDDDYDFNLYDDEISDAYQLYLEERYYTMCPYSGLPSGAYWGDSKFADGYEEFREEWLQERLK